MERKTEWIQIIIAFALCIAAAVILIVKKLYLGLIFLIPAMYPYGKKAIDLLKKGKTEEQETDAEQKE